MPRIVKTLQERLMARVRVEPDGCWTWTGPTTKGYGKLSVCGRLMQAHRASYEDQVGPIPAGLQIDHLCRNRACINPAHLEPVTHRENVLRGDSFAAENSRVTQCLRGHALTGQNVRVVVRPHSVKRYCRKCDVIRSQKWKAKQNNHAEQL